VACIDRSRVSLNFVYVRKTSFSTGLFGIKLCTIPSLLYFLRDCRVAGQVIFILQKDITPGVKMERNPWRTSLYVKSGAVAFATPFRRLSGRKTYSYKTNVL
jgi:hypothetical protein